jgi:hypothetical protein
MNWIFNLFQKHRNWSSKKILKLKFETFQHRYWPTKPYTNFIQTSILHFCHASTKKKQTQKYRKISHHYANSSNQSSNPNRKDSLSSKFPKYLYPINGFSYIFTLFWCKQKIKQRSMKEKKNFFENFILSKFVQNILNRL